MNKKTYSKHNRHEQNKSIQPYKKPYYPSKPRVNHESVTQGFFSGNLAPNMKFGSPGSEVSGYVKRKVTMKDAQGNETSASEIQFFNSGKRIKVNVNGNESENIE